MIYNIAIVGSTGAVGREMLETLSYRKFPCKNVYALASKSSLGKEVSFGDDKVLKVQDLEDFDFSKVDIHYVGSVAFYLQDEITRIGKKYNLKTGRFIKRPIEGLVEYHKRNILK